MHKIKNKKVIILFKVDYKKGAPEMEAPFFILFNFYLLINKNG